MKRSAQRKTVVVGVAGVLILLAESWGTQVWAQNTPLKVDTGDTAWVLVSSAFVLAMLMPGLALFYGGLVRTKNVLGTIMQSVMILSVVSLLWILFGYSLAFGPDKGGVIGGLEWVGLSGVGSEPHPVYGPTIPHQAFMLFQLMFAAIAPALITGAFAERKRFTSVILFAALWSVFVYVPLAHWIWGGGWLAKLGALDFAGGAVIHISSGAADLRDCAGQAARIWNGLYGAPQSADDIARNRIPLVRLVWVQWRQRARRQRDRRLSDYRDPCSGGDGGHCLVRRRMGASRQTHGARSRQRRGGRIGDRDPGGRLYRTHVGHCHRFGRRHDVLRRDCLERAIRL